MVSNSKIDKIGDKIKKGEDLSPAESATLENWRSTFIDPLDYYHKRVLEKLSPLSIEVVALGKRLKRIPSIHTKLQRSGSLRLSTMQDVAGLRVILKTPSDLNISLNSIRSSQSKNVLKKLNDYHGRPKEDGYRSIHLIYQSTKHKRLIELQFRTELEHIWATAVEIYGAIQFTSYKTGQGDQEWNEFFRLLSSAFAMFENAPVLDKHKTLSKAAINSRLKRYIKKLKVIEHLAAATTGFKTIANSHSRGKQGKYALIELNLASSQTIIDIYTRKDLPKAISKYTSLELEILGDPQRNIVLANIESLESLQIAYPNYFLDSANLLRILGRLSLNQAIM